MNSEIDERIGRLQRLDGIFPAGRSARVWRLVFLLFGWVVIPLLAVAIIAEQIAAGGISVASALTALLLTGFGSWWGYLMWLVRHHRYEIRDGVIASLGRRLLWSVPIRDIRFIRESGSGAWRIWQLHTAARSRGLVLYPSLQAAISSDDTQCD